jgi:putative membrane protein
MSPSIATSTKTLKPNEIEIPNPQQPELTPELLFVMPKYELHGRHTLTSNRSPRSWRHRSQPYLPPSRRQTNGVLDAEDYFVRIAGSPKTHGSY